MNKKEALKRNKRKRGKSLLNIIVFMGSSIVMLIWSYYLFTKTGECRYGGSKLSALFAPMCLYFGNKGAALIPLTLGILFSAFTWSLYKDAKKSNK